MGKTTLFLLSLFSTLLLLGSFLAMLIFFEADFYSKREDQIFYSAAKEFVYTDSYNEFELYLYSDNVEVVEDNGNLVFEILDVNDNIVKRSFSAEEVEDWQYEYYFYLDGEYVRGGLYNLEDKEIGDYYVVNQQ